MKIFELGVCFGYLLIDISLACAVGGEGILGVNPFGLCWCSLAGC